MVAIEVKPEKLGAYRIRGKIGDGGMASVYVGKTAAGFLFAVKVIKAEFSQNREFLTMFLDEGKILSRLHHKNIARIIELGNEGPRLFIVMELLRGQSLRAVWDQAKRRGRRFAPELAAFIGQEVASALHHAHEAQDENGKPLQIVHRDVNPSNVIITYDGNVKVIDFGLAKAVNRVSQTAAGIVKGKISYLAPEQVGSKPIDRRTDIFTLGTTLWEIAVDRRLFKGETKVETVQKIHRAEIPDPREFDPEFPAMLWAVIKRCLAKNPDDRYANAGQVESALAEYIQYTAPNVDLNVKLAALMTDLFTEERKQHDAWLDSAIVGDSMQALRTLRPSPMPPSPGAFEPIVSIPPPPSVGAEHSLPVALVAKSSKKKASDEIAPAAREKLSSQIEAEPAKAFPWLLIVVAVLAIAGGSVAFFLTRH